MECENAGRLTLSGAAVLALGLLAGCGQKPQGLVLVTPSVTAPPILRSEADQIAIPVRVDAPIRFENRGSVDQVLGVTKTGCSCYGMATAESLLDTGQLVNVPPGGATELFFVAKELQGDAEQAFRVGFHTGPTSSSAAKAGEELRADCSMRILPDLVIEPASIVIDLAGVSDDASVEPRRHKVTITRVTRGKPDSAGPNLSMSPPLVQAESATREKAPEELSPGLWRTVWTTSLRLDQVPQEMRDNGGRLGFTFEFPTADADATERRSPPRDGQIPTILDVAGSHPTRQVTGQLILRRSRGIIVPSQLHFGVIPAGSAPRTRRLVLSAADHRPFVASIGDLPAGFEAEVDTDEPAEQQWVSVTFRPGAAGESEGRATFRTTHPDSPEIAVTLKARVQ